MSFVRSPVRAVVRSPVRSVLGGLGESGPSLPSLSVSIDPASVTESAGSTTGTVTRPVDQTTGILTVTLSSSDTSEATVPATVDIADGQQSNTFTITILNENLADGDQVATISASATDYNGGSANVTVTDVGVSTSILSSIAVGWFNPYDSATVTLAGSNIGSVSDSGTDGGDWEPVNSLSSFTLETENGATFANRPLAENHQISWDRVPSPAIVDVFAVVRSNDTESFQLLELNTGDFGFRAVNGNSNTLITDVTNTGHFVDGVSVSTRGEAHSAVVDGSWHIVRISGMAGSTLTTIGILRNTWEYDHDIATIAFVDSSVVAANLSAINTELNAMISDLNS